MPLDDRPAPQILQLTLTPTSGSSLATKIALHIGPASGSAVPTVATDALTLRVVASGPSSVAVGFGEPPNIPLQAKRRHLQVPHLHLVGARACSKGFGHS